MNIWQIQPEELKKNLIFFLTYKIIIDTVIMIYNYTKYRAVKPINDRILKAQKLRDQAGTGIDRNERRYQILDKYVKFSFVKLFKAGQRQNPMAAMQQMQPGQAPQMPQMSMLPLLMRFGPMMLSRYLFADRPAAVLYLPIISKLEKKDDKILQMLLKVCEFGRKKEEPWASGYVSRTVVGFVFSFVYKRILGAVLFGKRAKLGMMERLQLQQDMMLKQEHGKPIDLQGNEDLLQQFSDIAELSDVDAPLENTADSNDSSFSNSKV